MSSTMTERLACRNSNAELIEAVFERHILVDGFCRLLSPLELLCNAELIEARFGAK